ncbi:hypothetical protein VP01_10019g1, partial [Puccinia sorghi]
MFAVCETSFFQPTLSITILIVASVLTIFFLWYHGSPSSSSHLASPNLPTINITHSNSFLNSCFHKFSPNLDAENELNEGPQIRGLWYQIGLNLHHTACDAQFLHSNGIWETNLLLNEYRAFLRPNTFPGVTVNVVMTNFALVLQQFLLVSNNLTSTIELT